MNKSCPNITCGLPDNCCTSFKKVTIPAAMGDDSEGSPFAPQNGAYRNSLVEYEANGAMYMYSSDGIYTKMYYTADDMAGVATKSYVDTQDAKTLASAKSYTDDEIASTKNFVNYSIADAYDDMKSYVDGADAQVLSDAKSYADAAASSAGGVSKTYVDTQDDNTLQSAKNYTDSQVLSLSDSVANEFITKVDSLATVARTGSYSDLSGTPDIPVITMTSTDPGEGVLLEDNHFIGVYNG